MNRQQIIDAITEAENHLISLREKLNNSLTSFKTGDVFNHNSHVPLIVAEIYGVDGNRFHIVGCSRSPFESHLSPYSDSAVRGGVSYEKMLDYLNNKIDNGWQYVGNINDALEVVVNNLRIKDV